MKNNHIHKTEVIQNNHQNSLAFFLCLFRRYTGTYSCLGKPQPIGHIRIRTLLCCRCAPIHYCPTFCTSYKPLRTLSRSVFTGESCHNQLLPMYYPLPTGYRNHGVVLSPRIKFFTNDACDNLPFASSGFPASVITFLMNTQEHIASCGTIVVVWNRTIHGFDKSRL